MIVIILTSTIILFIIVIFSFPRFSPIPYFPSNKKDKELILNSLDLKDNQILFDLGAGDGWIIFETAKKAYAKKLNTQFIATEINPVLLLILNLRRIFHPNRKNIKIIYANMFSMNFHQLLTTHYKLPIKSSSLLTTNYSLITIYLYISPWYLEKTLKNIQRQFKTFNLISYMYPIKSLKKHEKIIKGLHNIYKYSCI